MKPPKAICAAFFLMLALLVPCRALLAAPAASVEKAIKVSIFSKFHPKVLLLEPNEPYYLNGAPAEGPLTITLNAGEVEVDGRPFSRLELRSKEPWLKGRINQKHELLLPANLAFHYYQGEIAITAYVDSEEYVAAVVQAELGRGPPAALAAQAILVRTFIAANRLRHSARGADLCDLTHCQVYRAGPLAEWALAAARNTAGLILTNSRHEPAEVFYSSTCGGQTVASEAIWPGSDKNLVGIEDRLKGDKWPLCHESPHFSWETRLTKAELLPILQKFSSAPLTTPYKLVASEKMANLVLAVKVIGASNTFTIKEQLFRQAVGKNLGWQKLKSSTYTIADEGDSLVFSGHGLGHQVGLCQYGAQELARRGYSARRILKHYFPRLYIHKESLE